MRFLTMVKMDESMPAGPPPPALFAAMDELAQRVDSIMLDSGGLLPSAAGAQVRVTDGKVTVVDGPFAEAKEVIGGYAIFELRSKEDAIEQARQFMELHVKYWPGFEGVSEVRQIADADFDPTTLGQ
jgi:hypothetical protein